MGNTPPDRGAKPAAVVLWLLLFFPVGLNLLWRRTPWPLKTKRIATGATAVWVIVCLLSNGTPKDSDTASPTATAAGVPQRADDHARIQAEKAAIQKRDRQAAAQAAAERRASDAYDAASAAAFTRYRADLKRDTTPGFILGVDAEDPLSADVTVSNDWFAEYPGVRLQSAQNLYLLWLRDCRLPGSFPPGFKVLDRNGNTLAETDVDGKLSVNKD